MNEKTGKLNELFDRELDAVTGGVRKAGENPPVAVEFESRLPGTHQ